jgi:hypothetical protein
MAKAQGMFIDDTAVIDAYVWALDKHRNDTTRKFRLLTDDDLSTIYAVRAELGRRWAPKKLERAIAYYDWRRNELDNMQKEFGWDQETRDLFGSMLSILWSWRQYGRSKDVQERLRALYPGASLFLQFLTRFQPRLTTGEAHDVTAL